MKVFKSRVYIQDDQRVYEFSTCPKMNMSSPDGADVDHDPFHIKFHGQFGLKLSNLPLAALENHSQTCRHHFSPPKHHIKGWKCIFKNICGIAPFSPSPLYLIVYVTRAQDRALLPKALTVYIYRAHSKPFDQNSNQWLGVSFDMMVPAAPYSKTDLFSSHHLSRAGGIPQNEAIPLSARHVS